MTVVAGTEPPPAFVPAGRPVVRFVSALAVLAAIFAALWWSGLLAGRVAIAVDDGFDRQTSSGTAVVTVRNEALLSARAGRLELAARRDRHYFEPPVRLVSRVPAGEVRIAGRDATRFTVRYAVDCSGYDRARNSERGAVSPSLRVRLHVTGRLGSGRSQTTDEVALRGACGDPIDPAEGR